MQHLRLKQQALLQQQSLDHPGILAPPQIEPTPSGNLPPGFDPSICRSVYVGIIHSQVTEPLLQEVFASTGPVEGCKLIRKEKPIKVNWAYASGQREDTSGHFNIFVGYLSPEVTDAMLDARVMWDQKTGRSREFGFVSFHNQQESGLAVRQIRCNRATKSVSSNDDKQSSDAKSVIELSNGSSEDSKETTNEAPENNPQYTTVYVGNLAPEASCPIKRFLLILLVTQHELHCHFHALGAGVIEEMGNAQSFLCGKQIKCSWGSKPSPPGTSSNPLPPPTAAPLLGLSAIDLSAYERLLAMSKLGGVHALMHPLKQAAMGVGAAGGIQAIYDGGFQNVTAAQQLLYYQ
ncbi:Oligouridylate-binding protein 1A [Hibiscus syriacus]|uniref:Oligouridylate-binding protein 1A n=1 Tax=Hibiscus syriacus TaxID=106335 RepID=A0A6A3BIU7_HIBSY|nr:Oligouridylate-binding protein 1A [Hibiscus syriacus]